jgi:hypothetical protein
MEYGNFFKNSSQHTQFNNQNSNFTPFEYKTEVSLTWQQLNQNEGMYMPGCNVT